MEVITFTFPLTRYPEVKFHGWYIDLWQQHNQNIFLKTFISLKGTSQLRLPCNQATPPPPRRASTREGAISKVKPRQLGGGLNTTVNWLLLAFPPPFTQLKATASALFCSFPVPNLCLKCGCRSQAGESIFSTMRLGWNEIQQVNPQV